MSLVKNVGTIGGLTAVSRVFGFVRDMLLARVLGAGLAADAFSSLSSCPTLSAACLRKGPFRSPSVPMYSRALHGKWARPKAAPSAPTVRRRCALHLPLGADRFSALGHAGHAGHRLAAGARICRSARQVRALGDAQPITFPYLGLVSLVAMLSGVLNARSRFGPGAAAPVLLNLTLISSIVIGWYLRREGGVDVTVATALSVGRRRGRGAGPAHLSGLGSPQAGVRLKITLPKLTPEVRRLGVLILPATFGAGIYQISQFVDTFFATSLPQGSLTLLKMGDRLNQMPLGIVGIALGTAILPMLSRHIHGGDAKEAQRLQGNAFEMATLLTLPRRRGAGGLRAGLRHRFLRGRQVHGFRRRDHGADRGGACRGIAALCDRQDPQSGLLRARGHQDAGLDGAHRADLQHRDQSRRGQPLRHCRPCRRHGRLGEPQLPDALRHPAPARLFHFTALLASRVVRQAIATAVMALVLMALMPRLAPYYGGGVLERIWSAGAAGRPWQRHIFAAAWFTGALDKNLLAQLRRRRARPAKADPGTQQDL